MHTKFITIPFQFSSCLMLFSLEHVGIPCTFPFVYRDCKLNHPDDPTKSFSCKSFDDESIQRTELLYRPAPIDTKLPWCSVRTYDNYSSIPNMWGFAKTSCSGEVPDSTQPMHLLQTEFQVKWISRVFYMEAWLQGIEFNV